MNSKLKYLTVTIRSGKDSKLLRYIVNHLGMSINDLNRNNYQFHIKRYFHVDHDSMYSIDQNQDSKVSQ